MMSHRVLGELLWLCVGSVNWLLPPLGSSSVGWRRRTWSGGISCPALAPMRWLWLGALACMHCAGSNRPGR